MVFFAIFKFTKYRQCAYSSKKFFKAQIKLTLDCGVFSLVVTWYHNKWQQINVVIGIPVPRERVKHIQGTIRSYQINNKY